MTATKILMLGWEFPPNSIGGLGTHTYELTKALANLGVSIKLVLPLKEHAYINGVEFELVPMDRVGGVYSIRSAEDLFGTNPYGNLFEEINKYVYNTTRITSGAKFDIIQANDWLTARAGLELKKLTGKPLIVTMHSTEYDRTAGNPWNFIVEEEKKAVHGADVVVTVSRRLKDQLVGLYGVSSEKIHVIHNAIDRTRFNHKGHANKPRIVLYTGRLSVQKGIDHLIRAFRIVADSDNDALLYIVGDGPEMKNLIELSIDLNLQDRVHFFGRVSDDEIEYLYSIADVYVMPSVSEPFGITALEAMASRTPTIISAQSGVSEVIKNTLKVDFWDSQQMADMILGILRYPAIDRTLSDEAYGELSYITWEESARKFIKLYRELLKN